MAKSSSPQVSGWAELKSFLEATFTSPGNGVFTVHSGQDKKIAVNRALYGDVTIDPLPEWKKSLDTYPTYECPTLYAVPSDSGGGIQRGANWGPLAIREYLYTEEWSKAKDSCVFFDLGDVRVNPHLLQDDLLNLATLQRCKKSMYGDSSSPLPVSPLSIAERMLELHHQVFPKKALLMLGGDHSVSYPAIKHYLLAKKSQGINAAIIHFDAHTDLLDERMGIPICFGSWTSHVLPFLASPDQLIQIGIRSSGKPKEHWEQAKGIKQFWTDEIQAMGYTSLLDTIVAHLQSKKVQELYITFDIDALDGKEASATGTPETNGLRTDDCTQLIHELATHFKITGADCVEVAPFVHHAGYTQNEPRTTLTHAVKIIHALKRALI